MDTVPQPGPRSGWTEVRVDAPLGTEELVADALRHEEAAPAQVGGPAEPPAPPGHEAVRTYLPAWVELERARAELLERLARLGERTGLPELDGLRASFRTVPPEDWAEAWKATWRPFRVGRLCVVPPWRAAPPRPDDLPLRLVPGGVFGTGRHPSTRTCLRELQRLPLTGARLVDAGTGTGILAVAAVLLGARHVFGFDVDPGSASHASELARDNGLAPGATTFVTGGFERLAEAEPPVDGVLANIYHDVVQAQACALRDALRPGGWLVVSGIHRRHHAPTHAAVEAAGVAVERDLRTGNWCTLVGRRA